MTIINLLPPEIIEKRKKKQQTILVLSVIGIYGALLACVGLYLNMEKNKLIFDIKKIEKENEALRPTLERIRQIEAENSEIKRRLGVIQTLIQERFKWVKILEEISKTITSNVWLSSIIPSGGNTLSFTCSAFSNFDVARFMVALMENPFFSDVQLGIVSSVGREGVDERVRKGFSLTVRYNL
ncbi:TPA: hypothetical protein DCX16_05940 [bacterium]|nr:hypothetical protein [bacterium]